MALFLSNGSSISSLITTLGAVRLTRELGVASTTLASSLRLRELAKLTLPLNLMPSSDFSATSAKPAPAIRSTETLASPPADAFREFPTFKLAGT